MQITLFYRTDLPDPLMSQPEDIRNGPVQRFPSHQLPGISNGDFRILGIIGNRQRNVA